MTYSRHTREEQEWINQSISDLQREHKLLTRKTVELHAPRMTTVRTVETIATFLLYAFLMLLLTAPAWIDGALEMLK